MDPSTWCPSTTPTETLPSGRDKLVPMQASTLCSLGWRPILITGLLRELLTRHFAEPLQIEELDLRNAVWRTDERTGILIETVFRWRGELVEKRPAVIIKPNARQNIRIGIADRLGPDEQGFASYQTFWVGSHTLFCIHGSGAGAEILATEVQRELTQFAPVVREYLGLYNFQVLEVGEAAAVEEARQSFATPITVGWCYSEMWKLRLESLKLRKVPLSVLLDGALVQRTI